MDFTVWEQDDNQNSIIIGICQNANTPTVSGTNIGFYDEMELLMRIVVGWSSYSVQIKFLNE